MVQAANRSNQATVHLLHPSKRTTLRVKRTYLNWKFDQCSEVFLCNRTRPRPNDFQRDRQPIPRRYLTTRHLRHG